MTKKDQVAEHMTQDGSFHLGLDNELYSKSLQGVFDNALFENLFAKIPKKKIGIFGSRKGTGAYIRKALGDRFAGYINSDTISDKCATMFDSVVIATGPDHYNQVKKTIAYFLPNITIYTLFGSKEEDNKEKVTPVADSSNPCVACHYKELFIRFSGNIFPCCFKWQSPELKIANIAEDDWFQKIRDFRLEACSCSKYTYRDPFKEETLDINKLDIELSLVCNSKCAMCIAHSPEYTDIFGNKKYEYFDELMRVIDTLRPKELVFQGGEIFIQKEAFSFIATIRDRFPEIKIHVLTNGNIKSSVLEKNIDLFDHYYVTLYGFQAATYEVMTGLQLNKSKRFIEKLSDYGKSFSVNYLCTPINVHESPLFLEWAVKLPALYIHLVDASVERYISYDYKSKDVELDFPEYGAGAELMSRYWHRILKRTAKKVLRIIDQTDSNVRIDGFLQEFVTAQRSLKPRA